jgi:hypothetical protein
MSIEQELAELIEQMRTADDRGLAEAARLELRNRIMELNRLEIQNRPAGKRFGSRLAEVDPYLPEYQATPEIESHRQKLHVALASSELADYIDRLMPLAEPYIVLANVPERPWTDLELEEAVSAHCHDQVHSRRRKEDHRSLPLGASRLGLVPDLPPGVEWPTHEGRKLTFLAQIDFSEIPHWPGSPFPAEGRLYVFAIFGAPWQFTLQYHTSRREALVRQPSPKSADEIWPDWDGETLEHDLVQFEPRVGLGIDPQLSDQVLPEGKEWLVEEVLNSSGLREPETYGDNGVAGYLLRAPDSIAGSPTERVNDLIRSGQLHPGPNGPGNDWICLLEIRSVGSMQWGDCGMLYFFIRRSDLRARDFSRVCMSEFST